MNVIRKIVAIKQAFPAGKRWGFLDFVRVRMITYLHLECIIYMKNKYRR